MLRQDMKDLWQKITEHLKSQVNEAGLKLFLSAIHPGKLENDTFYLEAVNDISREWIERKYYGLIREVVQQHSSSMQCVFVTQTREKKDGKPVQLGFPSLEKKEIKPVPKKAAAKSESLFNSKYSFDTFIVGKSNQFAHAICQAVCKAPGTMYNPVFIYGGVGLGKTHLIQALGQQIIADNPGAKVAYLSSEAFTNEYIDALRDKKPNEFRAKYRKKDILLIDDVQFLAKKEGILEEFFHTFNELFQHKKQIILTSDSPPKQISNLDVRITSRFEMGIVADIQPPDLETRVAILKNAARRSAVNVPDEVLMYLAQSVTSNIRELEGAFLRVVAYAGIVQKSIDQGLVDQVLKDFFRENPGGKVTITWIQKKVAEFYDIPEAEMVTKRRSANLVLPRQVAMKLSQLLVDASLSEIGSAFGGRDHTTVIHSIDKITKMMGNGFAEEFERIKRYVTPPSRG
ncbi:MAG: hypothetical protein ACD_28C00038G0003 [uncultured bacterium]|nr:MAG: hypothetical protein ACD_28C00038G0003 [uncultured bacterium]